MIAPKTKQLLAMLRTKLTDEAWSKQKPILLELGIYDKGENLRMTVEGIRNFFHL